MRLKSYNPTYQPNMWQLAKVISLIREARRPMIFAGGGVILSKGSSELTAFARKTRMPVTTSLMGMGAFPGTDPLCLGMIGMHGTYRANMSTGACDLLIAVGVRFDDRVTGRTDAFAAQAKIVHIDIDPTSIRKNVLVSLPLVGDCRITLSELNRLIEAIDFGDLAEQRATWLDQIEQWKQAGALNYDQTTVIKPQFVVETLYRLTHGQAIITTEVGQNQMWAAQYYHFDQPDHFITSGGLGVMGFGLPAAIGAQVAARKTGGGYCRRRQHPDEHPGDGNGRSVRPAGQSGHSEQPVSGHGPAVAGIVLRQALCMHRHGSMRRIL